jgi:uncharacterized protein YndB with AHSA1/START domain
MASVETETIVPVSPEEAWQAVVGSDWLGEETALELEPGGELVVRTGDDERSGFVEEVTEPERLVFWWSDDESDATRVEIDLEPEGDATRIRVVESRPFELLHEFAAPQMLACA